MMFEYQEIVITLVICFAIIGRILWVKLPKDTNQNETNDELDDKAKVFINEALSLLLNDENSKINQILASNKKEIENFQESKGEITNSISNMNQQTANLVNILTDNKTRGDAGEKIGLEKILMAAGFVKDIDYFTQQINDEGKKPDATIKLHDEKVVNIDSKFPLEGFLRILDLEKELTQPNATEQRKQNIEIQIQEETDKFLINVRNTISNVAKKPGYIDTEKGTLPVLLVYIPIDSVFQLLMNNPVPNKNQTFIEFASENNVILVGPVNLYFQLQTIKQSRKVFALQEKTNDIAKVNMEFYKESVKFVKSIVDSYDDLNQVTKSFKELMGTRMRKLDLRYSDLLKTLEQDTENKLDSTIDKIDTEQIEDN